VVPDDQLPRQQFLRRPRAHAGRRRAARIARCVAGAPSSRRTCCTTTS
jgi:hypothetical protein